MRRWRSAYRNRATRRAVVAGVGDSVMAGEGATTVDGGWMHRMAGILSRSGGFLPAHHDAWSSFPAWTFTGGPPRNPAFGIGRRTVDLPGGAVATLIFDGTSVDVHFTRDLFAATPRITVDGVRYTGPDLGAESYRDGTVWQGPNLPRGRHTLKVAAPADGAVRLGGGKPFNGDRGHGVHVYPGGFGGSWSGAWGWDDNAWPSAYAAVMPDLIIISLVHNDFWLQVHPTTTRDNHLRLVRTLRRVCHPNPAFLFLIPPKRADVTRPRYPFPQYVRAISDAAGTLGGPVRVLNLRDHLPDVADDTDGLYADAVHPNDRGHQRYAEIVADYLRQ